MRINWFMFIGLLLLASTPCAAAAAGEHAVGPAEMQAAIAAHVSEQATQRATIQSLARPEVRQLAESAGLDLTRAQATAAKLDGEELRRLATQAAVAEERLGADSIVIGSGVLIVILLVLLLLVAL